MAVKIKLMRLGKIRQPYYRVVVADSRTRRNGRAIETIGKYHPKNEPSLIEIDSQRAQYWLGVGAQPTESVQNLLEITGDWQKFKGLPGTEGTLKPQPEKADKLARFQQALAEANDEPTTAATTPKKKGGNERVGKTADAAPAEAATKSDDVVDATKDADAPAAES
ncbi:30S ribosomal protein S16 [Pseudonocardia sp. NPDC049635]|uniref:30S ribosomal protein S16 n=1 Tax=Pseudonocardia sp. NPDC049635 TaxID=3155506 RepID=UPI0034112CE9